MTIVGHVVRWLKYSLAFQQKWLKSILAFTEAKLSEKTVEHRSFAHSIWLPREQYISLLTDAPLMETVDIQIKRDELLARTNELYTSEPVTGHLAYNLAQKALKSDEEQYFSRDEINHMLPENLRQA